MANPWNPYAPLPAALRRQLGFAGVAVVLLVWFALSASGAISANKLPSPVSVVKALLLVGLIGCIAGLKLVEA